jgi:hypothetical protein
VQQGVQAGYDNPPDTDTPHCNGKNYSKGIKATAPGTQERFGDKGEVRENSHGHTDRTDFNPNTGCKSPGNFPFVH